MTFPERCPEEARLPNELLVRVLLDDRRDVVGRTLFGPLDIAAIYADYQHPRVKDADTRDLIRRLLGIHDRRMRNGDPIKEGLDDDQL